MDNALAITMVILSTLVLSAFFSGMETAFVFSNKLRIELDKKVGSFGSGIVASLSHKPEHFIVTMLIGNNIALVVYGLFMAGPLEVLFGGFIRSDFLMLLIQIFIAALIVILIAEFLPRALFRSSPNLLLKVFSIPTALFYGILYPFTFFIIKLSNLLLRLFSGVRIGKDDSKEVFSKFDLDELVSEAHDEDNEIDLEEHDIKIFQNALDLANVRVKACMIPRTEIVALPASSSMEELKQTFIETGHSNILIFEKSIDNIIGFFRLRDLFATPENVKDLIRKLPIVPESMAANKLLKLFVEQNKKLALVVDEFGGTSGLVTLEDVLEEIVGDIEDEHDSYELVERKIGDNEYLFSGRIEIDYINEEYGMSLPESDDYETLAGLVLIKKGDIPKINATIDTGKYIIRVVRVSETRIELLNVKKK
ncbi:MAG: hemolysin family protein [Bacteroidales bacterium]|jgi:CBS domain containing-hemolysin-like protein|nr:hemolysin family protein [Bacteroidales bacterium]